MGKYEELKQKTKAELEKTYDNLKDGQWFFVQKKMEQKSAMSLIILQTEK
jgi:ribosomal protein L29